MASPAATLKNFEQMDGCIRYIEKQEMSSTEKPISKIIRERRATPSFDGAPVPEKDLKQCSVQACTLPSGYNMQPWRFIVVRNPEQKKRLRAASLTRPRWKRRR